MPENEGRPWQAGGDNGSHGGDRTRLHSTRWPVVLQVLKRGRWLTVGKIVELAGVPVLATAIKVQQGTSKMASMPVVAIEYAERCGATWWAYRNDRDLTMRRIRLAELRRVGIPQRDRELYVRLDEMQPCAWQSWDYATDVVLQSGKGEHRYARIYWRGEHPSNAFCAQCPDAERIPPGCPGVCAPGVDARGCELAMKCVCFWSAGPTRLAAWDKWVAGCERLDGLVARDRRQREAAKVADHGAWRA